MKCYEFVGPEDRFELNSCARQEAGWAAWQLLHHVSVLTSVIVLVLEPSLSEIQGMLKKEKRKNQIAIK